MPLPYLSFCRVGRRRLGWDAGKVLNASSLLVILQGRWAATGMGCRESAGSNLLRVRSCWRTIQFALPRLEPEPFFLPHYSSGGRSGEVGAKDQCLRIGVALDEFPPGGASCFGVGVCHA